jgi:hypothetical protein
MPEDPFMWHRVLGCTALLVIGVFVSADAQEKKDPPKDGKKAKIVKVDVDKMTISVVLADGKKLDLVINDDVQFIGPRGGVSKERIKDDRVAKDKEITLVYDAGGRKLKEIHLAVRTSDDKDKPKDK